VHYQHRHFALRDWLLIAVSKVFFPYILLSSLLLCFPHRLQKRVICLLNVHVVAPCFSFGKLKKYGDRTVYVLLLWATKIHRNRT
jgi:hypothetical protein